MYLAKYGTVSGMWMAYVERYNNYLFHLEQKTSRAIHCSCIPTCRLWEIHEDLQQQNRDIEYDSLVTHVLEEAAFIPSIMYV